MSTDKGTHRAKYGKALPELSQPFYRSTKNSKFGLSQENKSKLVYFIFK